MFVVTRGVGVYWKVKGKLFEETWKVGANGKSGVASYQNCCSWLLVCIRNRVPLR